MIIPAAYRTHMTAVDMRNLFRDIATHYGYTIDPAAAPAWLAEAQRAWTWNGSVADWDIAHAIEDHFAAGRTDLTPQAITAIIRSYYGQGAA